MEVVIEGLRFDRGSRTILSIDYLNFPHGTTTALFGPNGSGKTSLLRLLAGLERQRAGSIQLGENRVQPRGLERLPVALAFQRPVFLRGSVRMNLKLGLELRGTPVSEVNAQVLAAARALGLDNLLDRSARALSAGEAQRANLARALSLRAPVTLLDEPLAGLDRVARARLLDELPHLLQTFATTTILVTHDREEAFRLADRLIVLVDGVVRAEGPSGEVYRHPPDRLTAELLGYMIVQAGGVSLGVPPGGLLLGDGEPSLELSVERTVDMGNHRDVVGTLNGSRVSVRLPAGDAPPERGTRVRVFIRSSVVLP